jgi:VWFA-related protein
VRNALFLAIAATAFGQETVPFDSGIVIRSTTNLVEVRVLAQDSKARPVTDLQRADFQIQDDRKPQPITLFSADRGAYPPAASNSSARQPSDSVEAPAGYSVILLDWLNTQYAYRLMAQEQFLGLLKKYQPRQKVAVYLLGHEPRLLHDFTSDMDILRQVVEDAGLEFGMVEDADSSPGRFDAGYAGRGGGGNTGWQDLNLQNKIFDTLHTLAVIADHLTHVPGRKSLVWLTAGFPWTAGGLDFVPRVETALNGLNKSDVAAYIVNACGLSSKCRSYPEPMTEISDRTGGTVFAGRNDLDEGMRLALEDMRISYTLGFNVPEGAALGPHEIRVRVNRPGVRLRYRESYDWAGK